MFGGTQGDYANPALIGCVSGSVLFSRRAFFFVSGVEEGSFSPSVAHLSTGCDSSFMNIHPGIICLLTSVGWCELPHNHDLTFSYGATVAVESSFPEL